MHYVAKGKYKAEANEIELGGGLSFRFHAFISYAGEDNIYIIGLVKPLEKDYG